jgi:hypothetical protein
VRCHLAVALPLVTLLLIIPGLVSAETPAHHRAVPAGLGLLARHSGLIFSGTALRVQHVNPDPANAVATTQITFRVQTAIRGVRRGQVIKIREWDGLWNSGERYQPGEHVLLFLYPESRLGLTSPVGGRLGRFRVDEAGRVEVQTEPGSGKRLEPIDVRRFAAEIRRTARE